MIPGRNRTMNESWHGEGDAKPLHVWSHAGWKQSVWFPTASEMEAMQEGHPVRLTVWCDVHPAVHVGVTSPEGEYLDKEVAGEYVDFGVTDEDEEMARQRQELELEEQYKI